MNHTHTTLLNKFCDRRVRRIFNPQNKDDVIEFKYFIENYRWKDGCPFYMEYPWLDIPSMCKDKYVSHMLSLVK